jgi:tetratricopeptide (TPR) repeat protein
VVLAGLAGTALGVGKGQQAERLFRRAFEPGVAAEDRVTLLTRVVKDHTDSEWADDALWILGETARREGDAQRLVCCWHLLLGRWPRVLLQDYTQTLEVYRHSRARNIRVLLEAEGSAYSSTAMVVGANERRTSFVYSNAAAFDPIPMLVWEDLAECYAELGRTEMALKAYDMALEKAPAEGRWGSRHREQIVSRREKLARQPRKRDKERARPVRRTVVQLTGRDPNPSERKEHATISQSHAASKGGLSSGE